MLGGWEQPVSERGQYCLGATECVSVERKVYSRKNHWQWHGNSHGWGSPQGSHVSTISTPPLLITRGGLRYIKVNTGCWSVSIMTCWAWTNSSQVYRETMAIRWSRRATRVSIRSRSGARIRVDRGLAGFEGWLDSEKGDTAPIPPLHPTPYPAPLTGGLVCWHPARRSGDLERCHSAVGRRGDRLGATNEPGGGVVGCCTSGLASWFNPFRPDYGSCLSLCGQHMVLSSTFDSSSSTPTKYTTHSTKHYTHQTYHIKLTIPNTTHNN